MYETKFQFPGYQSLNMILTRPLSQEKNKFIPHTFFRIFISLVATLKNNRQSSTSTSKVGGDCSVKYPFYVPMIKRQNQAFWIAYWRGDKPCNASCGGMVLYASNQSSVLSGFLKTSISSCRSLLALCCHDFSTFHWHDFPGGWPADYLLKTFFVLILKILREEHSGDACENCRKDTY